MSEIGNRVLARLREEPALQGAGAIEVEEIDGGVRLCGSVADIKDKRLAAGIAKDAGASALIDELRIEQDAPAPDDQLHERVDRELRSEPVFRSTALGAGNDHGAAAEGGWIRIGTDKGLVKLEGEVPSLSHMRLAEVLCWWIPGVTGVDNRLQANPAEDDNDGELSEAIRLVFDKDPTLDAQQINVLVRDGLVRLGGVADSPEQAARAERNCWCVPGVRQVRSELQVTRSG